MRCHAIGSSAQLKLFPGSTCLFKHQDSESFIHDYSGLLILIEFKYPFSSQEGWHVVQNFLKKQICLSTSGVRGIGFSTVLFVLDFLLEGMQVYSNCMYPYPLSATFLWSLNFVAKSFFSVCRSFHHFGNVVKHS